MTSALKIEILCTGDEILSGKTVNTNYSYMAKKLQENGFDVNWGTVVGDDRDSLILAFHQASERADVVIVNGGLGPTVDDLSQETAAQAAGVALELRQEWLSHIRGWYESRGRTMPSNNDKQAMLPAGAELIDNPVGTACGFVITISRARFMFTPGVPMEMRRMMDDQILSRLIRMRGTNVVTRLKRFHTFGIGESRADMLLDGIEAIVPNGLVKLGFQSHFPQLEIKLTTQGQDREALVSRLMPVEKAMRARLGHYIVAEDEGSLESEILSGLSRIDGSISVIETLTAGSVIGRLVGAADAEGRIKWGVVASDQKEACHLLDLDLDADQIDKPIDLAQELATALRIKSGATHGMAVLVDWESNEHRKPCATVFIGISCRSLDQI
ncbi:MAG: CinA family nicotinamide mononucleotide deamidase-related protein [Gammaproteobacteria bacterium]|nr:CinA family nicotinamide mononucleotide deamidase-related protein [Gammaproteobacteria bacterium]